MSVKQSLKENSLHRRDSEEMAQDNEEEFVEVNVK
jgi:hypothetical protein